MCPTATGSAGSFGAIVLRRLSLLGCLLISCSKAGPPPSSPQDDGVVTEVDEPEEARGRVLSTSFEHDRIFLELRTADDQPLRLFTDTGGGLYVQHHVVERLGLAVEQAEGDGGAPVEVVALPPLSADTPMPPVSVLQGRLPVSRQAPFGDAFGDGILGQAWFRDRVWAFDYGAQTLTLLDEPPRCDDGHEAPLGFQEQDGRRTASYPRIEVTVDGRPHDLLFDTGATVMLTDGGLAGLGGAGPRERATSFIVRSVFDRWRADHPDWPVIEAADRMADDPMIEVPQVTIGELSVGPVWFTARADPNFHEYMSQWMDRRVDGALGGSALRYVEVTVDYPGARACFRAL